MRPTLPLLLLAAAPFVQPPLASAQSPTPTPAPYASDERPLLVPPSPVADPHGADAVVYNPAAIELDKGGELVLLHADRFDRNLPGDGNAIYWKTGGFLNLGVEWTRPARDIDQTIFTFGSALPLGRATALGAGYATTFGKSFSEAAYEEWTVGFLTRPGRWLSLGGTLWNAGGEVRRPGFDLRPRYAGGLALRPLGTNRLTLAGDVAKTDGQDGEDVRFSARAEPIPGIGLYATVDDAERWTAGLTLAFTYGDAGSHAFANENGDVIGTSTRVRIREHRRETVFRGPRSYARMVIGGPLPDRSPESGYFSGSTTTLPEVLDTLATVRRDPTVQGVLVRLEGIGGGMATAQELRAAFQETRAAKKKVFCYFDNADMRMYYVAAACDRIALNPAGMLSIEGLSTGLAYSKGTLDKAGVQVEVARVGEYKGAPEPFLQTEPSKETLEVTNALLDGFYGQIVEGIASGRGLDPSQVKALIDGAFYNAEQALEKKLVDYVLYPDELDEKAKDFLGKRFAVVRGYRGVAPVRTEWGAAPRIAVVYASGAISEGESRPTGLFGDPVLGSRTIVRALREAKEDSSVKAVVLRVDSPGGSGFASDEIWREVLQVKKEKPVVVSMGDVAASGGYYVSMGASEIFALPGTITGSIGVFFLKPNFQGLYEKLDYRRYDFGRGTYSEMFTEARPFTDQERVVADRLVNEFYRDFIKKAAEGRGTTPEEIDAVGRGHVWTGAKAIDLKLVDRSGGLEVAVARAKELAKIPAKRRVERLELPGETSVFSRRKAGADELRALAARLPLSEELARLELLRAIGPGVAAWLPFDPAAGLAAHAVRTEPRSTKSERRSGWWPLRAAE